MMVGKHYFRSSCQQVSLTRLFPKSVRFLKHADTSHMFVSRVTALESDILKFKSWLCLLTLDILFCLSEPSFPYYKIVIALPLYEG